MTVECIGYAARSATAPLAPWKYEIRDPLPGEVLVEVQFCGICHSDIHSVRSEWGPSSYPLVPGHEFTGVVSRVGDQVSKHKVGDRVAIGCLVGSCRSCDCCKAELENYCNKVLYTYGGVGPDGRQTQGGYGKYVIAPVSRLMMGRRSHILQEHFVLTVPDALPLDMSAPLLCAGITVYSPLKHNRMDQGGFHVGVVGLGGLGHMAVQFAAAFGNKVTVITTSSGKAELAVKLGATHILNSSDTDAMHAAKESLDYVLDTVSAQKPMAAYLELAKLDSTYTVVGAPPLSTPNDIPTFQLLMKRRKIEGSCIGGIKETQEMLNFCAEKKILPYVEMTTCDQINEAYERVVKGDVKFRFVIDVRGSQPVDAPTD